MVIEKITLHNYNRLALTNLTTITLYPNRNMTILVGTGGIGKSSIVKEMSPIPADLKQYGKDGYKEIVILHDSIRYTLRSDKSTNKHFFYREKENLNIGGTRKQQTILVEKHFNYTQQIHDIVTGVKQFTTMSVSERKRWFISISNVDFTYSLKIYNKIKERNRDLVANIKLLNSKLATEKSSILSESELNKYKKDLTYLNSYLEHLLDSKQNGITTYTKDTSIESSVKELTKLLNLISRKHTISELEKSIPLLERDIEIATKDSLKIKEKIDKIHKLEDIKYTGDINSINNHIERIEKEINRIKDSIYLDIPFKSTETYLKSIIYIYPILTQHLTDLNEYRRFYNMDRDEYNIAYKTLNALEKRYKQTIIERDNLVALDRRYEEDKRHIVECDRCGNEVHVNYNRDKHINTKNRLREILKSIPNIEKEIEEYKEIVKGYEEYKAILDKINSLKEYPHTKEVLEYLFTRHSIKEDSMVITDGLSTIIEDLRLWGRVNSLLVELDKQYRDKEIIKNSIGLSIKDKERLMEELSDILDRINRDKRRVKEYKQELYKLREIKSLYNSIDSYLKDRRRELKSKLKELKNDYINRQIKLIKVYITDIENRLSDNRYAVNSIKALEEEVKEMIVKERATKLIMNSLSPNDGLIAKALNSTLNRILNDINRFVNMVWSYKLEIVPCDLDNSGLTYRFPVAIDGEIGALDISGCSSSQQEIINLGFKLTVMKYLGISNYPLILDEFAKSFDSDHLELAYNLIDRLITDDSINQTIMVSHYSNVYNRFPYATIVTLSKGMSSYKCKEYEYR